MRTIVVFLALVMTISCQVQAEVIYSNFGPGDSYDSSPYTVGGPGSIQWQSVAGSFVSDDDYILDSVEFAAVFVQGDNGIVFLRVSSDDGGRPGATVIYNVVYLGAEQIHRVTFHTRQSLKRGAQYWVEVFGQSSVLGGWFQNNTSAFGVSFSQGGGDWFHMAGDPSPAFRVNGLPLPELSVRKSNDVMLVGVTGLIMDTTNYLLQASAIDQSGWVTGHTFLATSSATSMVDAASAENMFYKLKFGR